METTKISWADFTFNPWMGCTKVSPACKNCYAERDMDHRYKKVVWGPNGNRRITSPANWRKPVNINKGAKCCATCGARLFTDSVVVGGKKRSFDACPTHGELHKNEIVLNPEIRQRVFCASLADVFESWDGSITSHKMNSSDVMYRTDKRGVFTAGAYDATRSGDLVTMDDLRRKLFKLIDETPNIDWLLLTKRPENVKSMWQLDHITGTSGLYGQKKRENVWLGCSVEDQEHASSRIPKLLECSELAGKLFLSCEPLVGPLDLHAVSDGECVLNVLDGTFKHVERVSNVEPDGICPRVDWVITGGESGPEARAASPDWYRQIRDQCASSQLPFHFKQWGEWCPELQLPEEVLSMTLSRFDQDATFVEAEGDDYKGEYQYRIGKDKAGHLLDGVEHFAVPGVA